MYLSISQYSSQPISGVKKKIMMLTPITISRKIPVSFPIFVVPLQDFLNVFLDL